MKLNLDTAVSNLLAAQLEWPRAEDGDHGLCWERLSKEQFKDFRMEKKDDCVVRVSRLMAYMHLLRAIREQEGVR